MNLLQLKYLRINRGLTPKEVANAIGIGEGIYRGFETGKAEIVMLILWDLADFYDTSVDFILSRCNNPTPAIDAKRRC